MRKTKKKKKRKEEFTRPKDSGKYGRREVDKSSLIFFPMGALASLLGSFFFAPGDPKDQMLLLS